MSGAIDAKSAFRAEIFEYSITGRKKNIPWRGCVTSSSVSFGRGCASLRGFGVVNHFRAGVTGGRIRRMV